MTLSDPQSYMNKMEALAASTPDPRLFYSNLLTMWTQQDIAAKAGRRTMAPQSFITAILLAIRERLSEIDAFRRTP